jgi:hypothetical protein
MKTTIIDVKGLPLDIEGQSAMPAYMGGITSADELLKTPG